MGNRYRNVETNAVVTLLGDDAAAAVRSGKYEPEEEGGTIPVATEGGFQGQATVGQIQSSANRFVGQDPSVTRAITLEGQQERLYNSGEHQVQAFGEGILRSTPGINLGWALANHGSYEAEQANKALEHNKLAGGVGTGLGVLGSLGVGLGGTGVATLAAEGAIYGATQELADQIITKPELTAETIGDVFHATVLGGGVGAGAGLLGKGFGAINKYMRGRREGIEAAQTTVDEINRAGREGVESRNAADYDRWLNKSTADQVKHADAYSNAKATADRIKAGKATIIPGVNPADEARAASDFATGYNEAEAAAMRIAESHQLPFSPIDSVKSRRLSRQLIEEVAGLSPPGVDVPAANALLKKARSAEVELDKIWGPNVKFSRDGSLDEGAIAMLSKNPEAMVASAKALDDLREAASGLHKMIYDAAGIPGGGWTKVARMKAVPLEDRLSHAEAEIQRLSDKANLPGNVESRYSAQVDEASARFNESSAKLKEAQKAYDDQFVAARKELASAKADLKKAQTAAKRAASKKRPDLMADFGRPVETAEQRVAQAEAELAALEKNVPRPSEDLAADVEGYKSELDDLLARKAEYKGADVAQPLYSPAAVKKADKLYERALAADSPESMAKALDELETHIGTVNPDFSPPKGGRVEFGTADETAALQAKDPHDRIAQAAKSGRKYVKTPASPELEAAIGEINQSSKSLSKAMDVPHGTPLTDQTLRQFMLSNPAKAMNVARELEGHLGLLEKFANKFDDGANGAAFRDALAKLDNSLGTINAGRAPDKVADIMQRLGMKNADAAMQLGQRGDRLYKAHLARSLAQDAKVPSIPDKFVPPKAPTPEALPKELKLRGINKDGSPITEIAEGAAKSAARRAGSFMLRSAVGNAGVIGAAAGGVGGFAMGEIVSRLLGKNAHLAEHTTLQVSRIAKGIERLAKGMQHGMRVVAPTTVAVLNNLNLGDEPAKPAKNAREAFKMRFEELARTAADPLEAQRKVHEQLADLRQHAPMVADRLEVQEMADRKFLYEKAPKDPGGYDRWGQSRWVPTDDQLSNFAAYARAKTDAVGVIERAVSGRLTPQEAEFLRVRRPAVFAEIQREIANNLTEIQEKSTYDQRIRIGILMDVPVDPLCNKASGAFFQQQFAERAANDQKPVDLNADAFQQNEPTVTQSMQGR